MVGTGDLSVKYLQTEDQHADVLSNAIDQESLEKRPEFLFGYKKLLFAIGVCVMLVSWSGARDGVR